MKTRRIFLNPTEPKSMKPTLKLSHLSCCRGPVCLLKDFNLGIEPGAVVRLAGPNGCGKSTLLKTMAGRLLPAQGAVSYRSQNLGGGDFHYLNHKLLMKDNLTVAENIAFWSRIYGTPPLLMRLALEKLGLTSLKDKRAKELSQGQIKRAQLSLLLLRSVPIWLLDEPLNSLDKKYVIRVGEMMHDHVRQSGMVIYASHEAIPGLPETVINLEQYIPNEGLLDAFTHPN